MTNKLESRYVKPQIIAGILEEMPINALPEKVTMEEIFSPHEALSEYAATYGDKVFLGIVGKKFSPFQPEAFSQAVKGYAKESGGDVVRLGRVNSRAYGFVSHGESEIRDGDTIEVSTLFRTAWDGSVSRQATLFTGRMVCANGMTTGDIKDKIRVRNTKNADLSWETAFLGFHLNAVSMIEETVKTFRNLASEKMTENNMREFAEKLIPAESKQAETQRNVIINLFSAGMGNKGKSRWDALNAVTEFQNHYRNYRDSKAGADINRFRSIVDDAKLENRALQLLAN